MAYLMEKGSRSSFKKQFLECKIINQVILYTKGLVKHKKEHFLIIIEYFKETKKRTFATTLKTLRVDLNDTQLSRGQKNTLLTVEFLSQLRSFLQLSAEFRACLGVCSLMDKIYRTVEGKPFCSMVSVFTYLLRVKLSATVHFQLYAEGDLGRYYLSQKVRGLGILPPPLCQNEISLICPLCEIN